MRSWITVAFRSKPPPPGGRRDRELSSIPGFVVLLAFGGFWLFMAGSAFLGELGDLWRQVRVAFYYRPITAQVERLTQPALGLFADEDKAGEIRYRYQVDGRSYDGTQALWPRNKKDLAFLAGRLFVEKGGEVTVYHDPGNPARSQLDPEPRWDGLPVVTFLSLFVVVGVLMLLLALAGLRDAIRTSASHGPRQAYLLPGVIYLFTYGGLTMLGTIAGLIAVTNLPWRVGLGVGLGLWLVVVPGLTLWLGRSFVRRVRAGGDSARKHPRAARTTEQAAGSTAKARWVLAGVFAALFAMGSVFGALLFVRPVLQTFQARHWTQVRCEIVRSEVKTVEGDEGTTNRLRVVYMYQVRGQNHTSTRFQFGEDSGDYNELRALAARFPPGKGYVCYVNPEDPADSVLVRQAGGLVLPGIVTLAFVLIGGGGAVLTLSRSLRETFARILKPRAGALALGVFLILGGAGTIYMYLLPLRESFQWRTWDETPCAILTSRMVSHEDDEGDTTYSAEIIYAYQVGGKEYRSDRLGPTEVASNMTGTKSALLQRYRPGSKSVCYVNPRNPAQAVLVRGMTWESLLGIGLAPLGMALGSLCGLVLMFLRGRARELVAPYAKYLIAAGVCLFANGLISLPFWEVVRSFQLGQPAWFTALFLTPFLLGALGFVLVLVAVAGVFFYRRVRRRR